MNETCFKIIAVANIEEIMSEIATKYLLLLKLNRSFIFISFLYQRRVFPSINIKLWNGNRTEQNRMKNAEKILISTVTFSIRLHGQRDQRKGVVV